MTTPIIKIVPMPGPQGPAGSGGSGNGSTGPTGPTGATGPAGTGLNGVKTVSWNYPTENAIAIQNATDGEAISIKSSSSAAVRWHIRDGGPSLANYSPQILSINNPLTDGNQVTFNIDTQESPLPIGYSYNVNINTGDTQYSGVYTSIASTLDTISLDYLTGAPDSYNRDGVTGSLGLPSVYNQVEANEDGVWIKNANWSYGPGGYVNYWNFDNYGVLHLPNAQDSEDEAPVIQSPGDLILRSNSAPGSVRIETYSGLDISHSPDVHGVTLDNNAWISDGQRILQSTQSRTGTYYANYQDSNAGLSNSTSVYLPVDETTSWFNSNMGSVPATVTFADTSSVQTAAVFDATSQGVPAVIFQWNDPLTKSDADTWPVVISGTINVPIVKNYTSIGNSEAKWQFAEDGTVNFPNLSSNQRTGSGETLKFEDETSQSIITGPTTTTDNPTAQRFVIAGPDGYTGTTGEGGDVYLWAGRGGSAGGSGGDIKVDAGNGLAGGEGGTIKVRGGHSVDGVGGFVEVRSGDSNSSNGGTISVTAGSGYGSNSSGGTVNIQAGYAYNGINGGDVNILTQTGGKVLLQGDGGEYLNNSNDLNNQIATVGNVTTAVSDLFTLDKASYASYYDMNSFGPYAINSTNTMPMESYDFQKDIHIGGINSSEIVFEKAGKYNIAFSTQFHQTNGSSVVNIWLNKNGTPMPWTNTKLSLTANDPYRVAAWNFFVNIAQYDAIELMWSSDSNHTIIEAQGPTGSGETLHPGIPSVIVTVNQVGV